MRQCRAAKEKQFGICTFHNNCEIKETISRAILLNMVESGWLKKEGAARSTIYVRNTEKRYRRIAIDKIIQIFPNLEKMDEAVHYPPVYFDNQYEEEYDNKNL